MTVAIEQLRFRRAEEQDVPILRAVCITTFYETYYRFDDPVDLASYIDKEFCKNKLASEIRQGSKHYILVELNKSIVGYYCISLEEPSSFIPSSARIERIYLLRDVAGSGKGRLVMDDCINRCHSLGILGIWLTVFERNVAACHFYERYGFIFKEHVEFEYGGGVERHLLFVREIGI